MDRDEALRRLGEARVGRLATVRVDGTPHVVPFVFALDGGTIYWAVDRKPKRSSEMTRLENIRANPNVEVVVDGYDEDWERLWWVRAGGSGRVVGEDQARRGLDLLRAKYPQYAQDPPDGPVVAIDLTRVAGWEGRR